jgi:hypothetical protein
MSAPLARASGQIRAAHIPRLARRGQHVRSRHGTISSERSHMSRYAKEFLAGWATMDFNGHMANTPI